MSEKKPTKAAPLVRREPLNDADLLESNRQCPAMSKRTGERCKRFCAMGMRTCRWHGSATRVARTAAAKRIRQASGYAADMLVEFMADPEVGLELRTRIAQDLLNRAGVSEKTVLQIGVEPPKSFLDFVGDALVDIDPRDLPSADDDVVDAEIVEDEPRPMTRGDRAHERDRQRARRAEQERQTSRRPDLDPAELEALDRHGDRDAAESRARVGRGREAYLTALNNGATPDEASRAAAYAADRKDRATRSGGRSSEARMTRE